MKKDIAKEICDCVIDRIVEDLHDSMSPEVIALVMMKINGRKMVEDIREIVNNDNVDL